MDRFSFQRQCVAETTGVVLNIGSKEDPAHLKADFGDRVLNCDISMWDTDYEQEIPIDVVMDCREPWPFDKDYAELVVMGDILEHLYEWEAVNALINAANVANKLCITVPMNANTHRVKGGAELWERLDGSRGHCTDWNASNMLTTLGEAGWHCTFVEVIPGIIVDEGLLVKAERND